VSRGLLRLAAPARPARSAPGAGHERGSGLCVAAAEAVALEPNVSGAGAASVCVRVALSSLADRFSGPCATTGAHGIKDTFPNVQNGTNVCFDGVPKSNTAGRNTGEPQMLPGPSAGQGQRDCGTIDLAVARAVFFLVPPVIQNGPINQRVRRARCPAAWALLWSSIEASSTCSKAASRRPQQP
jgi:hypothetical protein